MIGIIGIAIPLVCFTTPASSTGLNLEGYMAFLPHANDFLESLMPPQSAIETSAGFLSNYLSNLQYRDGVFAGPISLSHLYLENPEILARDYQTAVLRIKYEVDTFRANRAVGNSLAAPKLTMLNLMHKMLLRHSELRSAPEPLDMPALETSYRILKFCASFIMYEREGSNQDLISFVAMFREIVVITVLRGWQANQHLRLLPQAANNLLEYLIITSRILTNRPSRDVAELLSALRDRVRSATSVGSLEVIVDRIFAISKILLSEAATASDPSHISLIAGAHALVTSSDSA